MGVSVWCIVARVYRLGVSVWCIVAKVYRPAYINHSMLLHLICLPAMFYD